MIMRKNNRALFISFIFVSIALPQGKIIVFSGHSCSGKSTLARLVSQKMNAICKSEPEEDAWPTVAKNWYAYRATTAMMAMRQLWIELFVDADKLRQDGNMVIIDTYFLKTAGYYIDKSGMAWLVGQDDPYIALLKQLFELDEYMFPDANCVVLFDMSIEDWKLFLKSRGREWDNNPGFDESFALLKKYVDEATIAHCKKYNIPVIHFKNEYGDIDLQAEKLKKLLSNNLRQINALLQFV